MIKKAGGEAEISSDVNVIAKATKLILPGVGHYDFGMRNLRELGLIDILNKKSGYKARMVGRNSGHLCFKE